MTREIANWFHEREGELFTVEQTAFDRQQLVQLVNDSVDPVQQVEVDGVRYYGVISYDEHDGWYEYIRWDDAIGEVNMGVCAQCVQQAERPQEVARTIGESTETAREKFNQHYAEKHHSIEPSDIAVETGATLLSGTTIAGNEAIHPGMDGAGSGVDADFVRGGSPVEKGQAVSGTKTVAGNIQSNFQTPCGGLEGVDFDSSDSMWISDSTANSVYKLNKSGVEQSKFNTSSDLSGSPAGLGIDTTNCIWVTDSDESVHKFNQSGSNEVSFASPSNSTEGVGVESTDSLWIAEGAAVSIYKVNQSGTIQNKFSSPSDGVGHLDFDNNDSIWIGDTNSEIIYQTDKNINIISNFQAPSTGFNIQGIGISLDSSLWYASPGGTDYVYEVTKISEISLN